MPHSTSLSIRAQGASIALAALLSAPVETEAFPRYVSQVPNGAIHDCDNCHIFPGGPRNGMGLQIEASLSGGAVNWGAVFGLDADEDGFTNGAELGDPGGTWSPGDPNPTYGADPNDAADTPAEGGPNCLDEELCFGMDADCDGVIDEGFEDLGQPCMGEQGGCRFTGVFECEFTGSALVCAQQSACLEDGDDGGNNEGNNGGNNGGAQNPEPEPMILRPPAPAKDDGGCASAPGTPTGAAIGLFMLVLAFVRRR